MTSGSENHTDAPVGAPVGAYGWYSSAPNESSDQTSRVSRSLWMVVVILGLATFAVSFGSPVVLGFPVRVALLAATVAAVGLLPKQAGRGWIAVALSITGFLDALATWITVDERGWALTVIVALNALQGLAAVGALLVETRVLRSSDAHGEPDYSAYAGFVAAYQAYAAHYQQTSTQYYAAGQASAQSHAMAEAPADPAAVSADAAQEALRARYAQYGEYPTAGGSRSSTGQSSAGSPADPGLPDANHVAPHSQPYRMAQQHPGKASST